MPKPILTRSALFPVMASFVTLASMACTHADVSDGSEEVGVARSAVESLVVEAESAVGAGWIEADSTASGGRVRVFSVPNQPATRNVMANTPILSGVVRARGTAGCAPQILRVELDGQTLLMNEVGDEWAEIPLDIPAPVMPGTHFLALRHGGGGACQIRVDHVTFSVESPEPPPPPPDTLIIEAEQLAGQGFPQPEGTASGGAVRMFPAAPQSASRGFTANGPIPSGVVRARASANCKAQPVLRVDIDGQQRLMTPVTDAWAEYPLNLPTPLPSGAHNIVVTYRSGPSGCSLYVDHATFSVEQEEPPPPPPPNQVTVEGEHFSGDGVPEFDPTASNQLVRLFQSQHQIASRTFPSPAPVVSGFARVRGEANCPPQTVRISIDGEPRLETVVTDEWTDYPLELPAPLTPGQHLVTFRYVQGGGGCRVRFDHVTFTTL